MSDWTWFTGKELADRKLPGLPTTRQGIQARAEQEDWRWETRPSRGGPTKLYHISSLPREARDALALARAKTEGLPLPEPARGESASLAAAKKRMDLAAQLRVDRRLFILDLLAEWNETAGLPRVTAARRFEQVYNGRAETGAPSVPEWVAEEFPTVAHMSLLRWQEARTARDWERLAGRFRTVPAIIDACPALKEFILGLVTQQPHATLAFIRDAAVTQLGETVEVVDPDTGVVRTKPIPDITNISRWLIKWKAENPALWARMTAPDRYRSQFRPAVGRMYEGIIRPNQLWEIDASPQDVLCVDGRHSIYLVVDVATCRIKARITKTPKARAALLLLRSTMLDWGVPDLLRHDRGSDFLAFEFQDALKRAGVPTDPCDAFSPEQKASVERHIGSVQHMFMAQQPGFIGHDVADRREIEARKTFAQRLGESDADAFAVSLTAAELQQRLDDWIGTIWMHRPHDGLAGKTPLERLAESRWPVTRIESEGALDMLLAPPPAGQGRRKVGKKGLNVGNIDYQHPVLMQGRWVQVRLDPDDVGRVFVYSEDMRDFLCIATNPERVGVSRAAVAAEVRATHDKMMKEGVAQIRKAQRKVNTATLSQAIVARAKEQRAKEQEARANVVSLPARSVPHTTPELRAAAEAAATIRGEQPRRHLTPEQQAQHERVVQLIAKGPPQPVETDEDRFYARARALETRQENNLPITDEEREWLRWAQTTWWYRPRRRREQELLVFQQQYGRTEPA